jgi:hypothetical protein
MFIREQRKMKKIIPVFGIEIADRRKHAFHAFVVVLLKIPKIFCGSSCGEHRLKKFLVPEESIP